MRFLRRYLHIAAILLVGVLLGWALRPASAPSAGPNVQLFPAEIALDRRLVEVSYDRLPLDQAVRRLSEAAGISISIDTVSFNDAGIPLSTPVTIHLRHVTLEQALNAVVASTTDSSGLIEPAIDYTIRPNEICLTIGGPRAADNFVRAYDVGDLIKPYGQVVDEVVDETLVEYTSAELQWLLSSLLVDFVAPESWKSNGGLDGDIQMFQQKLLVLQSLKNHRAIRSLLAQSRESASPTPLPSQSAEAARWEPELKQWVSMSSAQTEARLEKVIDEFKFEGRPLDESLIALGRKAGVSIVLRKSPLESPGPWWQRKTTGGFQNLPLADALDRLLDSDRTSIESGKANTYLDWRLDGEVIVIGSSGEFGATLLQTRYYDVEDLIQAEAAATARRIESTGGGLFGPGSPSDALIAAVGLLIDDRENGTSRTLAVIGRKLVATQTPGNQRRIRRFLGEMRARLVQVSE